MESHVTEVVAAELVTLVPLVLQAQRGQQAQRVLQVMHPTQVPPDLPVLLEHKVLKVKSDHKDHKVLQEHKVLRARKVHKALKVQVHKVHKVKPALRDQQVLKVM
jgi:hypothetical protein